MGLTTLLEEIGRRAREREVELRRRADAEAELVVERAREDAREIRERRLQEAEQELRSRLQRERYRQESEARQTVTEARADLLDRVRERAAEMLGREPGAEAFTRLLPDLLPEARACLPEEAEGILIRCPARLEEAVRRALDETDVGGRIVVDDEVGAGVRVVDPSSATTVDATLDRLLTLYWPEISRSVVEECEERWAATGDR